MKQKVCIAGVALGIIMVILGIVVLSGSARDADALLSFSGEEPRDTSFGADFYTYSYDATRAAARNLSDLGELVEDAIGVLLMSLGAGSVLLSLYGYAGSRESGAPSQVANAASRMKGWLKSAGNAAAELVAQKSSPESSPEPRPASGGTWLCTCGATNPVSRGVCPNCGALKPARLQSADAEPAPSKKKASADTWTCFCGTQWPAHRGTCDNCGELKKNVLQPSAKAANLYQQTFMKR